MFQKTFLLASLIVTIIGGTQNAAAQTPNVLVQGAAIRGTNGILFDKDDRLHIASILSMQILVMDPETGEILDRLPEEGGIFPDDLIFGLDGSLYWTDIVAGEVGRRTPDGAITKQSVAESVDAITVSDDGRLFVAQCFTENSGLYEMDKNLVQAPRLIIGDLGACAFNGMDFGPDGFLYAPRWEQRRVARVDVDSGEMTTVIDDVGTPAAVKFDSHGRMHVVDAQNGEVLRVDTETGNKAVIARLAPGLDNLAFDSQNRLFVSSYVDGFIIEVLADGTTRSVSPGGRLMPGGVAVLGESVFVADFSSVPQFNGLTGEVKNAHFRLPLFTDRASALTASPDGDNLVLSTWVDNAVQVWNPETDTVLENYTDFAVPLNAIRFQGDLIVAELGTNSVVKANPRERITLASGLGVPVGLATTADDLWVSDWGTGSVLQLVSDGETLFPPIPVATGLSFPEGLAVAPDQSLLVVETGAKRLSRIHLPSCQVRTVANGLALGEIAAAGFPPTWIFSGVAVSPSGSVYITSDISGEVLRLDLPSTE